MSIRTHLAAAVLAVAVAPVVFGAETGSAQAGAEKVMVCMACHGMNGNSTNPEWPTLAGQNAAYISKQLELFKEGKRTNALMSPMALALSTQDMADIGAYYAQQTPTGQEAAPSPHPGAGQALYRGGDTQRGIPACMACHGPTGHGNPAAGYPALRTQHAVYTTKQLNDYAGQNRYRDAAGKIETTPTSSMMVTIAQRLTPEEVSNVATYIQGMR
ncbi:MAG: cytochrome c4 [Gammaproteobacteria bacterium]|nr:cytochrome c4 [Gammaproteobacteria bacterium]